jgi:hypothetical protein
VALHHAASASGVLGRPSLVGVGMRVSHRQSIYKSFPHDGNDLTMPGVSQPLACFFSYQSGGMRGQLHCIVGTRNMTVLHVDACVSNKTNAGGITTTRLIVLVCWMAGSFSFFVTWKHVIIKLA